MCIWHESMQSSIMYISHEYQQNQSVHSEDNRHALSYKGGFIKVPTKPGLGIDELNEKLIKKQACADFPPPWNPTKEWDKEWSNDRRWS